MTVLPDQVLLRISFGIAALIFEVVLLILLLVLGHGQRDDNMKFRTLVILVITGTGIGIMDNTFRVSDLFNTHMVFPKRNTVRSQVCKHNDFHDR